MIKKISHRITAFLMAWLMLFSSVGISMDAHFCQGNLKSFSFFGKAKTCYDLIGQASIESCTKHKEITTEEKECTIDQKACCENKTLLFQSNQNQRISSNSFILTQQIQQFVIAYVAVFFTNNLNDKSNPIAFADYIPPIISRDIPVLIESFLL